MFAKLRQAMIQLTHVAERGSLNRDARRLTITAAKTSRNREAFNEQLAGLAEIAQKHASEVQSWVEPAELLEGRGGPFDACDLRHWLVLAERAGVPYVPAREVLRLEENELSLLSGSFQIPDTPATRQLRGALVDVAGDPSPTPEQPSIDPEALEERLYAAMDDIPEGWMVRSNRCGGSELKALAGVGLIGETAPEVRFGAQLEVGPGWVRLGNRRRISVADQRTIKAAVEGPGFLTFLARPWVESARYLDAPDPHREGSPFAGNGRWPAEWRAFVEQGVVVGVASYYGWADHASPETAKTAIKVREFAQRIVDEAVAMNAWPRYPTVELQRGAPHLEANPTYAHHFATVLGRETVSCTLDFIEAQEGLMLLEGGPACSTFGGGHPCAFAGNGGSPMKGHLIDTHGVAFRTMEGVLVADAKTWEQGDRTGCILDWPEVEQLANSLIPSE